uniref:Uncharacterized protein n=1 Tax=Anguilla anguilla TaxID=7936 RepID=A0A0E9VTA3_ANGAN
MDLNVLFMFVGALNSIQKKE